MSPKAFNELDINEHEIERAIILCKQLILDYELDLKNLNVLTECASGPYTYTSILAGLAGATVTAIGKDSVYGLFKDNKAKCEEIKNILNLENIDIVENNIDDKAYQKFDILTNTGFNRPYTANKIKHLKKTAVIPLMWETWEFRVDDLDINACQKHSVPVIGTNESFHKLDMFPYVGYIAMKLLFELNIEIYHSHLILLGSGEVAFNIANVFNQLHIDYIWFSSDNLNSSYNMASYDDLETLLNQNYIDAVICAEHANSIRLFDDCKLNFKILKQHFPNIRWGHISGNIDPLQLKDSNILYFPKTIMPFGYMSYQCHDLGVKPVLELHIAGLKVGEIAARARLNGASVEEAIQATVDYGVGQDFEGGFMNFDPKNTGGHHD